MGTKNRTPAADAADAKTEADEVAAKIRAAMDASPVPLNAAQIQAITHPRLAKATPDDLRALGIVNGTTPDEIEGRLKAAGK